MRWKDGNGLEDGLGDRCWIGVGDGVRNEDWRERVGIGKGLGGVWVECGNNTEF